MKDLKEVLKSISNRLEKLSIKDVQLWNDFVELEEVALFFYKVINKCPVAIYLTDAEKLKLIWANQRTNEVLGRESGGDDDQNVYFFEDNIHPQDLEISKMNLKRFEIYPNQIQENAYRIRNIKSNRYQWQYELVTVFNEKEGRPKQFLRASFNLNDALQDRLDFLDSIKNQSLHEAPSDPLTGREKEILRLIVRGFSMREVAEKLRISHHTASTHRKNLFKKTKVNKTSELIRYAMKNGLD